MRIAFTLTGRQLSRRDGRALSARGLPPPPQLLSRSFWSDRVDGRKFAGQPQVAKDESPDRMTNREVNSPDFLGRCTDLSGTPDWSRSRPRSGREKWDSRL